METPSNICSRSSTREQNTNEENCMCSHYNLMLTQANTTSSIDPFIDNNIIANFYNFL